MTKIVLIGLEQTAAEQICRALALDNHRIEQQPEDFFMRELLDADIVFAGGEPACYMSLLRHVREARPALPFVVVTRIPETKEWLDALEAGATDYCSEPDRDDATSLADGIRAAPAPLRGGLNGPAWGNLASRSFLLCAEMEI